MNQLIRQYKNAGKPVWLMEHDVDKGSAERKSRWWAARGSGGSATLPLILVDSGYRWSGGKEDFNTAYRRMIDAALVRPPTAELKAYFQVDGRKLHVNVSVKNLMQIPLGRMTSATINVLVVEEKKVIHIDQYVRYYGGAVMNPDLLPGQTGEYEVTLNNVGGLNWSRTHVIVLLDYQNPGGRAFDAANATEALEGLPPTPTAQPTIVIRPTETPTPTATPVPPDLTVSGRVMRKVEGAPSEPEQPIVGATVGLRTCGDEPQEFESTTDDQGRYEIVVPGVDVGSCEQVTLYCRADGYPDVEETLDVDDLRADGERDISMVATRTSIYLPIAYYPVPD